MRRRDLLNLGGGEPGGRHRCVQPGGDPLQALLDGNARFVDFGSRYQQVSYPPSGAQQRLLADYEQVVEHTPATQPSCSPSRLRCWPAQWRLGR